MEFLEILILFTFRKDNKLSRSLTQSIRSGKSNLRKTKVLENSILQNQNNNNNVTNNDNYINYDNNKLSTMCNDENFSKSS